MISCSVYMSFLLIQEFHRKIESVYHVLFTPEWYLWNYRFGWGSPGDPLVDICIYIYVHAFILYILVGGFKHFGIFCSEKVIHFDFTNIFQKNRIWCKKTPPYQKKYRPVLSRHTSATGSQIPCHATTWMAKPVVWIGSTRAKVLQAMEPGWFWVFGRSSKNVKQIPIFIYTWSLPVSYGIHLYIYIYIYIYIYNYTCTHMVIYCRM